MEAVPLHTSLFIVEKQFEKRPGVLLAMIRPHPQLNAGM
jgi:hypothetical protein